MSYIRRFRILITLILWLPIYFLVLMSYVFVTRDDLDASIGVLFLALPMFPGSYIISVVLVGFISSFGSDKREIENNKKGAVVHTLSVGSNLVRYIMYFVGFVVLAYLVAYLAIWINSDFTINPFTSL